MKLVLEVGRLNKRYWFRNQMVGYDIRGCEIGDLCYIVVKCLVELLFMIIQKVEFMFSEFVSCRGRGLRKIIVIEFVDCFWLNLIRYQGKIGVQV